MEVHPATITVAAVMTTIILIPVATVTIIMMLTIQTATVLHIILNIN
jgi:hypothetical protein